MILDSWTKFSHSRGLESDGEPLPETASSLSKDACYPSALISSYRRRFPPAAVALPTTSERIKEPRNFALERILSLLIPLRIARRL